MVVFYVKDKVAKSKDGYEVAGALKDKIENEEGFFEFRMLKVEPYREYILLMFWFNHFTPDSVNFKIDTLSQFIN